MGRNSYNPKDNALFISNRGTRLTTRAIQIVIKNAVEAAGLSRDITTAQAAAYCRYIVVQAWAWI